MAAGFVVLSVLSSFGLVRRVITTVISRREQLANPVANLAILPKDRWNLKMMIFQMESTLPRGPWLEVPAVHFSVYKSVHKDHLCREPQSGHWYSIGSLNGCCP